MEKKINPHVRLDFPHIILFFEGGSDEISASLPCLAAYLGMVAQNFN